jgi:hypothetical protein
MPHFDSEGYDTWICQECGRVYSSKNNEPIWMTPVPGKKFNGNVCKSCYDSMLAQAKGV